MAQRGGKRPGAGRKPGSRNKATDEQLGSLTDIAQQHTAVAMDALVTIAAKGQSESARVAAATAILDRGYGKPPQAIEHSGAIATPSDLTDAQLAAIATGRGPRASTPSPRTDQLN